MSGPTIRDEIQAVIDAHPDNVNPTEGGHSKACVYDDGNGHHCLIGEWAVDQELPLPTGADAAKEAGAIAESLGWVESDADARWLNQVQEVADGALGINPVRWGDIELPPYPSADLTPADPELAAEG